MSDDDKSRYLDPATNPMIPRDEDDPEGLLEDETETPDPNGGLVPWPPPSMQDDDGKDALHGLDQEALKKLAGPSGTGYVYGPRFYDADVPMQEKLGMAPALVLTRDGDVVQVKRADGGTVITAAEADLIRAAIADQKTRI